MCGCLGERMCQGVKGSSVPAVDRLISVTPSCQPAVIDVSYVDNDGQTVSVERNRDVVGVCGDMIRRISELFIDCFMLFSAGLSVTYLLHVLCCLVPGSQLLICCMLIDWPLVVSIILKWMFTDRHLQHSHLHTVLRRLTNCCIIIILIMSHTYAYHCPHSI